MNTSAFSSRPILILLLTCACAARASDDWLLTSAELQTQRVTLRAIDGDGITVGGPDGKLRSVGLDQFLQIDRVNPPRASGGRFVLQLGDGQQISGEPGALQGELLLWTNATLGELKIPLNHIVSMSRSARAAGSEKPTAEDVVTLTNGDTVRGIIASIRSAAVVMQASGGDSIDVPLDAIASVRFAPMAGSQTPTDLPRHSFRIGLIDSTSIIGTEPRLSGQELRITLPDNSQRSIPAAALAAIEQLNGPVVWLSSAGPIENIQVPFLDMLAPARMNESVIGGAIRFGARTFSRGIGVHSYSRLTWAIDPQYKAFRTQYALDGHLPYANVTVRIKLDDRVAHEKEDFRAGVLSPLIVLETDGAKTITLEVDYGESYDVQDRFNWIEPALLKSKPAPPPAISLPSTASTTSPATQPTSQPE